MDYQTVLKFLFEQLPFYQRDGEAAYKADLERTLTLDQHLGHPHRQYKTIHIAGTNGKGSVAHALASVLQSSGLRVGLYTSPHLLDYRERIRVNGVCVPEELVCRFVSENQDVINNIKPSFFELTVALAFYFFAQMKVDIAVVETGLGGRLDSTNIINPVLSIITNIALDHTRFLGNSLEEIAVEKAGIIKADTPVVIGAKQPETGKVFFDKTKQQNATLYYAADLFQLQMGSESASGYQVFKTQTPNRLALKSVRTDLLGGYQQQNIATVLAALAILQQEQCCSIHKSHIAQGLLAVKKQTGLRGRWDVLQRKPLVIADCAHNAEGIRLVFGQIDTLEYDKLHVVWGMVADKDIDSILSLLPTAAQYYFTQANIARALPAGQLCAKAERYNLSGDVYNSVYEAFVEAMRIAQSNDLLLVGGSTFVVADILKQL